MTADRNRVIFGISIPRKILRKIDNDRGPIPRSRFLLKLIEIAYNTNRIKMEKQFFTIINNHSLSDESLGDSDNLPPPNVIARK